VPYAKYPLLRIKSPQSWRGRIFHRALTEGKSNVAARLGKAINEPPKKLSSKE
jgi:hypothetical protein